MATKGNNRTNRPSSGSAKTRKNSANKSSSRRSPAKTSAATQVSLFSAIQSTSIGRLFLGLLASSLLILLDFLISWNQFNRFFMLIGIEILIAIILGFIIFLVRGQGNDET